MAVLDFRLPTDSYDVNVTPDKRKVMLHCEQEILMRMKEALAETFAPSRYTFAVGDAPHSRGIMCHCSLSLHFAHALVSISREEERLSIAICGEWR